MVIWGWSVADYFHCVEYGYGDFGLRSLLVLAVALFCGGVYADDVDALRSALGYFRHLPDRRQYPVFIHPQRQSVFLSGLGLECQFGGQAVLGPSDPGKLIPIELVKYFGGFEQKRQKLHYRSYQRRRYSTRAAYDKTLVGYVASAIDCRHSV